MSTPDRTYAALHFGGTGQDVLLVHEVGANAGAFTALGTALAGHARVVAVDQDGHGWTPAAVGRVHDWSNLPALCAEAGVTRPVVVTVGVAGWRHTAAAAAGIVDLAGLVVIDGVMPWDADDMWSFLSIFCSDELQDMMARRYRYGWRIPDAKRDAFVTDFCAELSTDWLYGGAPTEILRAEVERSLIRDGDGWLRRPDRDQIRRLVAVRPTDPARPSIDLYRGITIPLWFVSATKGFYAQERAAIDAVVHARGNRRELILEGSGALCQRYPAEIGAFIADLLASLQCVERPMPTSAPEASGPSPGP